MYGVTKIIDNFYNVMIWVVVVLPLRIITIQYTLLGIFVCNCFDDDQFKSVDVIKLSNTTHGTELALLDNAYKIDKTYNIDDFFWTGSGDGPIDNDNYETSTIYKTQTILSTVYIGKPSTYNHNQSVESTTTTTAKCSFNCEGPSIPDGEINPTSSTSIYPNNFTGDYDDESADRQFWLLTVLKGDGKDPVILDLKNNLAKLYKTAFSRQQERHLGINNRQKRDVPETKEPVNVYIHNVAKSKNGEEKIEVLYHVSVSGKPVDAVTAAADMTLVTDEEVMNELGYPFVVKAEPYLKPSEPQELVKANNTWLFIGSSLSILIVLLLAVAFLSLCLNKQKKDDMGTDNKQQVFNDSGQDNFAFENDQKIRKQSKRQSPPTYINFKRESLTQQHDQGVTVPSRPGSSVSYTTTSGSSLDISPLMGLHNQQRGSSKKTTKSRPVSNKTIPLMPEENRNFVVDSDSSSRDSPDTIYVGRYNNGITSPKSYLSMPSVKSFPSRGNMPEPLHKVLEPVSVLHLDLHDDCDNDYQQMPKKYRQTLVRHGSMGTDEDPGVVGPVVWNMHCRRLQHGVSVDEGMNDMKGTNNMNRMRKRFHDLLDDTFSLFGSRRDSPNDEIGRQPIEVKSHSAITCLNKENEDDEMQPSIKPRPKTSEPRRALLLQAPINEPIKGAWSSKAPSPLIRPLSAGHFQKTPRVTPRVDVDLVLAEGKFQANDPAVPLIAAIKDEIGKCTLPGSINK